MKRVWAFYVFLPVVVVSLFLMIGFSGRTAAAPGSQPAETTTNVQFDVPLDSPDPNETFRLVNIERSLQGVSPLIADEKLAQVASARAADMAKRQYYAHKNPDGKYYFNYFDDFGIAAGYNCENLDLVFVPNQQMVINEWMASLKGHRECMVNSKVTHAGYATAKLNLIQYDGSETVAYLVVAIHAEQL